jgi:hypothetical protein
MSEWGSQCVLATHSVAFLTPSPHTRAYQLTRTDEPDHADIAPLDPSSLTPYADLAETVGLDRGELLTRWRAFVFADPLLATVVDELAGDQLAHPDIRLIPLPPPGDRPPSEITLLADLTAAPLILLTTTPTDEIARLRDHPAHGLTPADGRSAEAASTAAVLELATQLELDIAILPLTIRHPFDLLHPDAIRRCTPTRSDTPPFPGHHDAHQRHATADRQESVPYPDFLHATYGISPHPATVHAVAHSMRDGHLPVDAQLTDALWQIERIALDAEAR